jgi:hypothetical protein
MELILLLHTQGVRLKLLHFEDREISFCVSHGARACHCTSAHLPIQRAPDNFVDRPRRVTQGYVLSASAIWMLALPALPALLISPKTKRAVWISASASRALRRYPVVHTSLMLAVSANRHDPSISISSILKPKVGVGC